MLAEVEAAIVDRLAPLKSQGIKVLPFPENPGELGKPATNAQIFVGFKRETLEIPQMVNYDAPSIQPRILEYELILKLKDLRSHKGVYPILDKVRDLLTGFRPLPNAKALYATTSGFVDLDQGSWVYSMTFAFHHPYQRQPERGN
jgi:hypothetical protein